MATAIVHAMDFALEKVAVGQSFDLLTRAGIAFSEESVDVRARSQLPPMQAVSYTNIGRVLRVVWDLSKQFGYKTWKFDIFVEGSAREVLVGTVALYYDL